MKAHDYKVIAWDKNLNKLVEIFVTANNKREAGAMLRDILRTAKIQIVEL